VYLLSVPVLACMLGRSRKQLFFLQVTLQRGITFFFLDVLKWILAILRSKLVIVGVGVQAVLFFASAVVLFSITFQTVAISLFVRLRPFVLCIPFVLFSVNGPNRWSLSVLVVLRWEISLPRVKSVQLSQEHVVT